MRSRKTSSACLTVGHFFPRRAASNDVKQPCCSGASSICLCNSTKRRRRRIGLHLHLVENSRSVCTACLYARAKWFRNRRLRLARCYWNKYIEFP